MSSLDPADLAELGRDRGATLIGQGRQGPPGDPRLLLADITPGDAVTPDEDGNPVGISVATAAELAALYPYTVTDPTTGVVTRLTPATCGIKANGTPYVTTSARPANEVAFPTVNTVTGRPTITKTGGR